MSINWITDQLLVRVWKACNFKCNFCNVSENERNVKIKENIDDIVRNFHYKLIYSNISWWDLVVTISGWEPSIFKNETIFALKYINNFCIKKNINTYFEIQTNWSNIDRSFANKLKYNWIELALVSFHVIDKDLFEKIINVNYKNNFHKILEWIENLHLAGIDIDTNTILSNENKDNFFDTLRYLNNNFKYISTFNIWLIQPHWDALTILKKVMPRYEEVEIIYNKAIFYLLKQNRNVVSHFVWLPPCYLVKHSVSLEISENIILRKKNIWTQKFLINDINDNNKIQNNKCLNCLYNNICSWIWKEYDWLQKLNPIIYVRDFNYDLKNYKNTFWYKLKFKDENLKRIYDKNIRQIIVSSSLWNKKDIYKILKECTNIWFYKITLLVDSEFMLEKDIFFTWVWNIQVQINCIDIEFINELIKFSIKYTPQFKIDLDIFIESFDINNLKKLKLILKKLPNKFLHLFFIYNFRYKNINIYKYNSLLSILYKFKDNIKTVNFNKNFYFKNLFW